MRLYARMRADRVLRPACPGVAEAEADDGHVGTHLMMLHRPHRVVMLSQQPSNMALLAKLPTRYDSVAGGASRSRQEREHVRTWGLSGKMMLYSDHGRIIFLSACLSSVCICVVMQGPVWRR